MVEKSAWNAGDVGSIPGLGRSPGEENGNLVQYSCLGNPMDRGALQATVHEVTKAQMRLSMHARVTTKHFTHNSVYMSVLFSQFTPPSSSCSCPQVPSLHLHFLLLSASFISPHVAAACLSLQKIWLFKAPKFPILQL